MISKVVKLEKEDFENLIKENQALKGYLLSLEIFGDSSSGMSFESYTNTIDKMVKKMCTSIKEGTLLRETNPTKDEYLSDMEL